MLLAEDQPLSTHFDRVIVALPAPQAASLLTPVAELSQLLGQWPYRACWAVMATLATPLSVPWNAAFINSGPIRWLARNGTKPMRAASPESLVIHATFDWTESHLDAAPADVAQWLLDASAQALAVAPIDAIEKTAHRWLYALPGQTAPQPTLVNRDQTVIACGDWAGGPRVEGAFLSGMAAAGRVLGKLTGPAAAVQQLQLEF
jgi:predicted NAD/FAD-dependent oxidoreductase